MRGTSEDVVGAAQLLQVRQSLELRGVDYFDAGRAQPEVVVYGIIEKLQHTRNLSQAPLSLSKLGEASAQDNMTDVMGGNAGRLSRAVFITLPCI